MTEQILFDNLGKKIKEFRKENKLKQWELAERCNFQKATMSKIESGNSNLRILTLKKISGSILSFMAPK